MTTIRTRNLHLTMGMAPGGTEHHAHLDVQTDDRGDVKFTFVLQGAEKGQREIVVPAADVVLLGRTLQDLYGIR